jgi:hypothetical protein
MRHHLAHLSGIVGAKLRDLTRQAA